MIKPKFNIPLPGWIIIHCLLILWAIIIFVVCYLATHSNFLECMHGHRENYYSYNGIPLKHIGNTDNEVVTIHRQSSIRTLMLLRLWIVTHIYNTMAIDMHYRPD